ncbi:hypothetical protein LBMAG52_04530 [Planctomycetia bacterium]|nr:hypothetical protein LBMAG52_04530 [Planctomycetia bacterium]
MTSLQLRNPNSYNRNDLRRVGPGQQADPQNLPIPELTGHRELLEVRERTRNESALAGHANQENLAGRAEFGGVSH